jgi:uncharacterized surface protein with fasciclin (FAS1) repeats
VLCEAVLTAGLGDALSGGLWTVFAPTDDGFTKLLGKDPIGTLKSLDKDALTDLLLYHVVADDDIYYKELGCDDSLMMANSEKTWT